MLNFSVGPVQMAPDLCDLGANPVPYFRTAEFSQTMLENERMLLSLVNAPSGSRAVFLTGSGTAAMEAAVMAAFTPADRVLAVNGGSFGARFVQLCQIHGVPVTQIELRPGQALTRRFHNPCTLLILQQLHSESLIRIISKKLSGSKRINLALCCARVMVRVWSATKRTAFCPSTEITAGCASSVRMVMVCDGEATTGLCCNEWAQMGVSSRHSTSGHTIGPPAESEYPVEPVGVATSSPSPRKRPTWLPLTNASTPISRE